MFAGRRIEGNPPLCGDGDELMREVHLAIGPTHLGAASRSAWQSVSTTLRQSNMVPAVIPRLARNSRIV